MRERGERKRRGEEREREEAARKEREREAARASDLRKFYAGLRFQVSDEGLEGWKLAFIGKARKP